MADVWEAYKFLNEALDLNLDDEALMRAEGQFKLHFMQSRGFALQSDERQAVQDWEFFSYLAPARAKSWEQAHRENTPAD